MLERPGPNSGNTYTCTCTCFCKTGLSRATFYRHAPYRAPYPSHLDPPEFSASFQAFLDNSSAPGSSTGSNLAVGEHCEHEDSVSQDDSETFGDEVSRISGLKLVFIYSY